jgi:hypothetical protein
MLEMLKIFSTFSDWRSYFREPPMIMKSHLMFYFHSNIVIGLYIYNKEQMTVKYNVS